jgi:hypothetical protein
MQEPVGKPPEKKLSPWKQFLEDVSWDIWFFRAFGNLLLGLFFEEGKAVKSGWFAFAVFTVIAFWSGCHYSERNIDAKLSDITNYFGGILAKKESDISELKGALANVKADRDKNQLLLAPFQAAALKIYTNEPLEQRLDLLAGELGEVSKQAKIGLSINNKTNLVETDLPIGTTFTISNFIILNEREIRLHIHNESKFAAIKSFAILQTSIDKTNLTLDGWIPEPPHDDGHNRINNWRYDVTTSIPRQGEHHLSTIKISTNYTGFIRAQFSIGADNAEGKMYMVDMVVPK